MIDANSIWLWNLSICLMLMAMHIHRTEAGFSPNGCDILAPNSKACYGRGTSDAADAMGNLLNGNETYVFIQTASVNYVTFIGVAKYDWQAGVSADLLFLGAIGFVINIGLQSYFGKLVGCPTLQMVNNTDAVVDGFNFLTGADITTAQNLFMQTYNLQCNVFPVSRLLDANQLTNLNVFLSIDVSGLRSLIAAQRGQMQNLKSIAQNNIVSANVIVDQQLLTSQTTVQQTPSTAVSAACVVTSAGADGNQIIAIVGGNVIVVGNTVLTGNQVCAVAVTLANVFSSRSVNLLDTMKLVTASKSKVFTYSVGYAPNFVPNDLVDGLLTACSNPPK